MHRFHGLLSGTLKKTALSCLDLNLRKNLFLVKESTKNAHLVYFLHLHIWGVDTVKSQIVPQLIFAYILGTNP